MLDWLKSEREVCEMAFRTNGGIKMSIEDEKSIKKTFNDKIYAGLDSVECPCSQRLFRIKERPGP